METETHDIMNKLNEIKSDLDFIKGHVRDIDVIMTEDDYSSLDEAESDFKTGKTKRL